MNGPDRIEEQVAKDKQSPGRRFIVQRGANKRSLSRFADIEVSEEVKRTRPDPGLVNIVGYRVQEDAMDDLDQENMDGIEASPSQPTPNFANTEDTFRVLPPGVTPTKKIAIKNYRKRAPSTAVLESEVSALLDAVTGIHKRQKISTHSLEELFGMVINVCDNDRAEDIYNQLIDLCRLHLSTDRDTVVSRRDVTGEEFLATVGNLWRSYCDQMLMIRNVFVYLDRTFILSNPSIQSIWDSSLIIFSETVMDHEYIRERLVKDMLAIIADERRGNTVNRDLIRSLIRMLTSLRIYEQVFEMPFLETTRELYGAEGRTLSCYLDIASYLKHVQRRFSEERERVELYLDISTKKVLVDAVEKAFISDHMHSFVPKGLDSLLDGEKCEELHLLYTLLQPVEEGITLLKAQFTLYIKKHGKTIVMDTEREKEMVEELMTFKDKMDRVLQKCFNNHDKLSQALKDSFDYFVNTRPNKPAELIAKFVDGRLRSGNKEASDEELDHIMDKVIVLFRFIHGKDVFEAFYKKDLAKRLLLSRSASVDAEKAMLSKLKHECGAGFTQKLESMFKDMELSKDLDVAFKQHESHKAASDALRTDFSVSVLTSGQWPHYEFAEANLPSELSVPLQVYQEFYVARHNGRKLTWQYSLGTCLLKATFKPGCVKELQASLFQTLVFLLFNDKDTWTTQEIADATKIEKKELYRTLQSLACAKPRYLIKTPKGREIGDADQFEINTELNVQLFRLRVSQVQMKETEEEHAATEEQVNQDRQYQIDAAIVRIMKARKILPHQSLISELFGQLRFPVNSSDLKTRIASLMERDYLSRDAADPNTYHYVS